MWLRHIRHWLRQWSIWLRQIYPPRIRFIVFLILRLWQKQFLFFFNIFGPNFFWRFRRNFKTFFFLIFLTKLFFFTVLTIYSLALPGSTLATPVALIFSNGWTNTHTHKHTHAQLYYRYIDTKCYKYGIINIKYIKVFSYCLWICIHFDVLCFTSMISDPNCIHIVTIILINITECWAQWSFFVNTIYKNPDG